MELAEGHPVKPVPLRHLYADHVDTAAGEGLHGGGGGEAEDAGDLPCRRQIGVDDHVHPDLPLQQGGVPAVVRIPHPCDGVLGPHGFGDEATHQIRLVQIADSDDQIRRPGARPPPAR